MIQSTALEACQSLPVLHLRVEPATADHATIYLFLRSSNMAVIIHDKASRNTGLRSKVERGASSVMAGSTAGIFSSRDENYYYNTIK